MKTLPLIILLCVSLCCCTTRHIINEKPIVLHDTTYKTVFHERIDTFWCFDSISVVDTLWLDTTTISTLGMPVLRHNRSTIARTGQGKASVQSNIDTVLRVKEKPIATKYTEIKEVNKIYWWQKLFMCIGLISMLGLFNFLIYKMKKIFLT